VSDGYRHGMTAPDRHRRSRVLGSALIAALALVVTAAVPASAHTSLVSSDPADGAVISAPLEQITLTFDEPLMESVDTVSVNDAAGNVIASVQVQPQGAVLTVPWPSSLEPGNIEIAYRAVADDGHPVIGAIHFTYAGDTGGASAVPVAPASAAPASASAAETAPPSAAAVPDTPATSTTSSGVSTWMLGIVLLAALVVLGFVLGLRRRMRP